MILEQIFEEIIKTNNIFVNLLQIIINFLNYL